MVVRLFGYRAGHVGTGILQQFLVKLSQDPRIAALLLCAWSNPASPFGALHLGFGRLVIEAAPYIVYACWGFVRHTCLLRPCDPDGKKEYAE